MVNFIWIGLMAAGLLFAAFNGTLGDVTDALIGSADDAVTMCITLAGVMVLWLGLMNVARQAGLLRALYRLLAPVARRIFPDVPPDHPAMGYILSNMVANLLGLGNAATPLGIKAMEQLKALNCGSDAASRPMVTLLVINTAGITLVPTTVIALRAACHAPNPADILLPTFAVTALSCAAALVIDRLWSRDGGRK